MKLGRKTFFERSALYVLMAIFFLVPFALRGARLSLERMKNDVKDWLPSDFAETSELDWFRDHFLGEQFVLVSWEGCTADDQRLALLEQKLVPSHPTAEELAEENPKEPLDHRMPDFIGDKLSLYYTGDDHKNWGGKQEKWLKGEKDRWFYVLPNGEIYAWKGRATVLGAAGRAMERVFTGGNTIDGKYVKKVDEFYYEKPTRLQARLFKSVTTGPEVLAQLASPEGTLLRDENPNPAELEAARKEALERLKGSLFGPDGKQTCLVVTLTEAGKVDLRRTLGHGVLGREQGRLLDLAEEAGVQPEEIRLGGPPIDNVSIDEEGERTLARLVTYSVVIGLTLSYLCLRSVKLTMMVFFVGGISAITSLSLVWWTAGNVIWWLDPTTDAVMMSMPSVVYVLGLSGAIHIINYYKDAASETGTIRGAPELAVAHGWYPCTIAAITTAVGLASLGTSSITPIHKFGIFSAMGVLATLVLLFTYLPAALQIWPPGNLEKKKSDSKSSEESAFAKFFYGLGEQISNFVIRRNVTVSIGCLVMFLFFAAGLSKIQTSVKLLKMFDDQARIIEDYAWLETHLGKLVPMELVVRVEPQVMQYAEDEQGKNQAPINQLAAEAPNVVDEKFRYSFLERMEMAQRVSDVVQRYLGAESKGIVGPSMSALTFAPDLPPSGGSFQGFALRGGYNRRLQASINDFRSTDYLRFDNKNGAELWRVSLRLGADTDIDYGKFVGDLRMLTEPIMQAYKARDEILMAIDESNDGQGYQGASVALLGVSYPTETPVSPEAADEDPIDFEQAGNTIFSETLRDLLVNARVKLLDHDPSAHTEKRFDYILDKYDYIAVVKHDPMYKMDAITNNSELLFDLSDSKFIDGDIPRLYEEGRPPISMVYTGVVPIVYKAANTLLNNLVESTVWAFVLIAFVMMAVLKSFRAGMISMLPNIFPICVVFGFMSWVGIKIDIGTMMTASVAMGVAVDDTVHFLTWFRWGLDQGFTRADAIREAYRRCALAMFQTTIIGGLGLAVFALSTFTPTQRFGCLMVSLLSVALIGDLIFLPALLAGPLGKVFKPNRKRSESKKDSNDDSKSTDDNETPTVLSVQPQSQSRPA